MAIEPLIKEMDPRKRERLAYGVAVMLGVLALAWALNVYVLRGHRLERDTARKAERRLVERLRDGDLVFQVSRARQSEAIQLATGSVYGHCGLVFRADTGSHPWLVLEAAHTVQWTPLAEWIAKGEDGHWVVKRLGAGHPLEEEQRAELRRAAERHVGRPYDGRFTWSDERIYCSELVWKAYHEATGLALGALRPLRAFHLAHPAVARKLEERYGGQVPLDEPMIAPSAVFGSPLLETVGSAGREPGRAGVAPSAASHRGP